MWKERIQEKMKRTTERQCECLDELLLVIQSCYPIDNILLIPCLRSVILCNGVVSHQILNRAREGKVEEVNGKQVKRFHSIPIEYMSCFSSIKKQNTEKTG